MRSVRPVSPAAPYVGGKKNLAGQLVELIDSLNHETYAEPFIGMGGVFLRRTRAPAGEVINDISGDVTTFFRILQRHYEPFMDMLKFRFTSRREFERLEAIDVSTLTDLERAVRFLYLQRCTYSGKVHGRKFGIEVARPGRFDITRLAPMLTELNERLAGVIIENLNYREFIEKYDAAGTLFYLDPPYYGSEDYYGPGAFSRADFADLAQILAGIKGKFILSINDTPQIRETFAAFEWEEAAVTYTFKGGDPCDAKELIITPPGLRSHARRQSALF